MSNRKGITKRLRFEIFKRDMFTCQYCGRTPPAVILNCDHVIPVASGGTSKDTNLITACFDCNSGKSDKHLDSSIPSVRERLEIERERADQANAYNQLLNEVREKLQATATDIGFEWNNKISSEADQDKFTFGPNRHASVVHFLKQLPESEVRDAMDLAFARRTPYRLDDEKTWKYFCGICWNKIKEG